MIQKKTFTLNNYIYAHHSSTEKFKEQFLSLIGPYGPIMCYMGTINRITCIKMCKTKKKGGLTAVLSVIVNHTKPKYLKMLCSDTNPHGNRPSSERIEYFHALHAIFGIDETNRRQVHNFDQRLRSVIEACSEKSL